MAEILRDARNEKIGQIEEMSDGTRILRDRSNRKIGTYYPDLNLTRDGQNRRVGTGDLLTSLLRDFD